MRICTILSILIMPWCIHSQQIADTAYSPTIQKPAYDLKKGPVVFIDEGHHNFHTKNGRFLAFTRVLEKDGYQVIEYPDAFIKDKLADGKILVIANALHEKNISAWYLPTPSAFTESEIEIVKNWVHEGGRLFLIADHMPMAGAAEDLAAAFGFTFTNGFVVDTNTQGPAVFSLLNKTLHESILTRGRDTSERVEQIATFTGQGFQIPNAATPILQFNENYINMLPDTAWVFNEKTPKINMNGWSQGAFAKYGKGRIVVFGEAAMFTAQLAGPQQIKVGMNSSIAKDNFRLLLNIIRWLDGKIE